jgi:hypothetical protein
MSFLFRSAALLGGLAGLAVACNVFTPATAGSSHNYVGAAAFAGTAVAATGVNRAVTGDCWSQCPRGSQCNHETGVCERLPCSSSCPADLTCELVGGEYICVQPAGEGRVPAPSTPSPPSASGDAGVDAHAD